MNDIKIKRLDIDKYDVLFDNRHKLGVNFDEDLVTKVMPYKVKLYIDLHKDDKDINALQNILDNDIEYILWEEER